MFINNWCALVISGALSVKLSFLLKYTNELENLKQKLAADWSIV